MESKKYYRCYNCHQEFSLTQKHHNNAICPSCSYSHVDPKERTIQEYKERYPHAWSSKIRDYNRKWNEHLTHLSCQNCSYEKHVELAHISPVSTYNVNAKLKELNHEDNVLVLCPNCHYEFDEGQIALADIPMRVKKK